MSFLKNLKLIQFNILWQQSPTTFLDSTRCFWTHYNLTFCPHWTQRHTTIPICWVHTKHVPHSLFLAGKVSYFCLSDAIWQILYFHWLAYPSLHWLCMYFNCANCLIRVWCEPSIRRSCVSRHGVKFTRFQNKYTTFQISFPWVLKKQKSVWVSMSFKIFLKSRELNADVFKVTKTEQSKTLTSERFSVGSGESLHVVSAAVEKWQHDSSAVAQAHRNALCLK